MSEQRKEAVSALVDGELPRARAARVLDDVLGDEEMRRTWTRYQLVGDVIRKTVPVRGSEGLVERVRAAIDAEPVPLRAAAARAALRPLAGAAIAASVAVAAIVSVRGFYAQPDGAEIARADAPSVSVVTASAPRAQSGAAGRSVAAITPLRGGTAARLQWDTAKPDVERRLNGYLVNHSEYLGNGTRGLHPYVRIVGYETGQ